MPTITVTGWSYADWLAAVKGWRRTEGGAELYVHPDEVWVTHRTPGAGRSAGPKETKRA